MAKTKLKFIDLFAGLGGFHLALHKLGHECVFASELMPELRSLNQTNHGIECAGDINQVDISSIRPHDILCGGFPCQPFSQTGSQQGFNDEKDRGNLFYKIMEILEHHKPEFVFLENVPNLKSHDNGNTYKVIKVTLETLYEIKDDIISPHCLGVPLSGRAFRFNLFVRNEQKGFPLQSLTQSEQYTKLKSAA